MRRTKNCVAAYIALLAFLAPVKFGSILYTGKWASFPLSFFEWLLFPWPAALLAVLSGLGLLAVLLAFRVPSFKRNPLLWLLPGCFLILPLGALPGLLDTTEWERALLFLWNLLTAATLGTAVLILLSNNRRYASLFLAAIVAGTAISVADGWHEIKGGGLEQSLEFAEQRAAAEGVEVNPLLRNRLTQGRASGTFFYPNSFGGYLILALPVCFAALWHWGGRIDPPGISRALFLGFAAVTGGLALYWSGSRAAFVALGGGLVFATLFTRIAWRWRCILIAALLLAGIAGGIAVNRGRSLASLEARWNYWEAAADMAFTNPLTGVGLGEFYPEFSKRLEPGEELAREPHNYWLLFAAEAGALGALAATLFMTLPGWFDRVCRPKNSNARDCFVFAARVGLTAWVLHSLTDMNFHVPGLMATAAMLPAIALAARAGKWTQLNPGDEPAGWGAQTALALLAIITLAGGWRLPGEFAQQKLIAACSNPETHTSEIAELAATAAARLPHSPYPWLILADAADRRERPEMVAHACRKTLERTPHRGSVWRRLSAVESMLGNDEAAAIAHKNAAEWDGTIQP